MQPPSEAERLWESRLSRDRWRPDPRWSILEASRRREPATQASLYWQCAVAADESNPSQPWDGLGPARARPRTELADRSDPSLDAALHRLAARNDLVGWNAVLLLVRRNPTAASSFEPVLSRLARGETDAAPVSVGMQSAAAEAWCLVLMESADSWDALAPAGRQLERTDLPNEVRETYFRTLARRIPPDRIPRLGNSLLVTSEGTRAPVEIRRAALEACVIHARTRSDPYDATLWPNSLANCRTDPDAQVRKLWGRWLAWAGHPDAVDRLRSQLLDVDPRVRDEALLSLGVIQTDAARAVLHDQMRQPSEAIRAGAVRGLAAWGAHEIIRWADDPSFRVRTAVAEELAAFPEPQAALTLRRLLADRNSAVQLAALQTAATWPREFALPLMLACLRESNLATRQACLVRLRERFSLAVDVPAAGSLEQREAAVNDLARQWGISLEFLTALRSQPSTTTQPDPRRIADIEADLRAVLQPDLADEERQAARERLLLTEAAALPVIEQFLLRHGMPDNEFLDHDLLPRLNPAYEALFGMDDRDVTARRAAARQLKQQAERATLSTLIVMRLRERLAHEQDRLVWQDCMDAVLDDASDEAAELALLALNHTWPDLRLLGCRHVARHRRSAQAVWLLPLLRDSNRQVQIAAVEALGLCRNRVALEGLSRDDGEPLPGLRPLLMHSDRDLRFAVVVSMCRLGDEQAMQELIRMGYDPNPQFRRQVVVAMGDIGQSRFIAPLIELAWTETSDAVRLAILQSLEQLVPAGSRPEGLAEQSRIGEKVRLWVEWWTHRQPGTGNRATARRRRSRTRLFRMDWNPLMAESTDDFRLEWHGDTVVITPAANVEEMHWELIEQAAEIVMAPLRSQDVPMVVFDLTEVNYFGSVFLALLLRCHKFVKSRGGELVICGASKMAKELLRVTALDTLWAIYETREEALEAVGS